jgi:hypothetical protein
MNPFGNNTGTNVPAASPAAPVVPQGDDFDLIARAQMSQDGPKMNPDHSYVLRVEKIIWRRSNENPSWMLFIPEFTVLETDDPMYQRPDAKVGLVVNSGSQGYEGRILAILCALNGIDPSDVAKVEAARPYFAEGLRMAVNERNGMAGKIVRCKTGAKRAAKKSGREFMPAAFTPYVP